MITSVFTRYSCLTRTVFFVVLITVSCVSATVITLNEGVTIDWSDGVLVTTGVGRADFSSSIARPSRRALFDVAIADAKRKILNSAQVLWSSTPLLSNRLGDAQAIVDQVFVAHPPRMNVYSDGSVHAFMQLPLSSLDPTPREDLIVDGNPLVIRVPSDYAPTLGIIFCLDGETRSIAQSRVTVHDSYTELPTFLQTNTVTNMSAAYDSSFQCLKVEDSPDSRSAWLSVGGESRVYVVRLSEDNVL